MYKQTVLYRRASSTTQTLDSQTPELRRWAEANGVVYDPVDDIATGRNMGRPGMQKVIKGIESGETKRVVVVSLNRVGRNVRQVAEFIDLCITHKVQLICLREGVDLSTPFGRMIALIIACVAQLENEQRSDATKAGIQAAKEKAEREGREWKTGGSEKGYSLKVTQEIADTIHFHHQRRLSYRKIGKIVHLSDKTVRDVILNPRGQYLTRSQHAAKRSKKK